MESTTIDPGKDFPSIGPSLPAELPKAPYNPKVSGKIAFFFGPFSGALVTVVNLRRTGHPLRAKRVLWWTLMATAALAAALYFIPDAFSRLVGLVAEIGFYLFYPPLQEKEFNDWQATNPDIGPSNGWKAIVWAPLGIVLCLLVFFLVMFPLFLLFPNAAG